MDDLLNNEPDPGILQLYEDHTPRQSVGDHDSELKFSRQALAGVRKRLERSHTPPEGKATGSQDQ